MPQAQAFIFAGINGAGKSTLYYDELLRDKSFGIRINTDEFVSSFGSWKNPKEQFKASKIALKLQLLPLSLNHADNDIYQILNKGVRNLEITSKNLLYKEAIMPSTTELMKTYLCKKLQFLESIPKCYQ